MKFNQKLQALRLKKELKTNYIRVRTKKKNVREKSSMILSNLIKIRLSILPWGNFFECL